MSSAYKTQISLNFPTVVGSASQEWAKRQRVGANAIHPLLIFP